MNANLSISGITLLGALLAGLTGCQIIKPTEDSMRERAQISIGQPVTKVSNVRSDTTLTYYTASTAAGDYNCQLPSGAITAVASMGMMTPSPSCLPKGASPIPFQ